MTQAKKREPTPIVNKSDRVRSIEQQSASESSFSNDYDIYSQEKPNIRQVLNSNTRSNVFTSLTFKMSIGLIFFIAVVIASNYFVTHTKGRQVVSEQAELLNREIGQSIVLKLRERLVASETLTKALAKLGTALPKDVETFKQVFPKVIDQAGMKNLVAGGGVWPEPNQFEDGVARRSFFWGRNEHGVLEYFDDYNDPESKGYHQEEWYVPARHLQYGQVYWSKSYMDPYSLEPMVTCTVPMIEDGVFKGVATIDLRLTGLSEFMFNQARLVGGYAFALDRNNRLLSFPLKDHKQSQVLNFKSFVKNEYPTISDVAQINSGFKQIEAHIDSYTGEKGARQEQEGLTEELDGLAKVLARDSYQIGVEEAYVIASILLGKSLNSNESKLLTLAHDPILSEASSIRVISLPKIGWKVVLSMPATYSDRVVDEISEGLLSHLLVLLVFSALVYVIFFNLVFLEPINQLTQQVRKLVSREDHVTRLKIPGSGELAQLASWFNIRTSQLSEALDKLKYRNLELNEARENAESANRSKNIFLASMSHDIRTPMNAIIGLSDVLKKTKLNQEQDKFLNVISTSAQALLSLINDIMDFSKIEANQLDLEEIPFDLREVVDDCADLISFQAQEKRLEFLYYLSPEINRKVKGDPNRIRQVILNLATNAVKFTSSGRVELWLEAAYQNENNIQLIVEVRDTGIGLSKSAQGKLFSPFVQGDSSTTRKYGGTGLGLTICKHLAELMGGSVDYRSEEGVGTTFIFKLKLRCQNDSFTSEAKQSGLPNKVLLLEGKDHSQNSVLEQYFLASGIEFQTFTSVSSWLMALSDDDRSSLVSVSTDPLLLNSLEDHKTEIPSSLDAHKIILMADKEEFIDLGDTKFEGGLYIEWIEQPLKYDELIARLKSKITDDDESKAPGNAPELECATDDKNLINILVVEDNKVNQQVLIIMLGYLGFTADIANDGVEAVEALEKKHYDLIFMDWQMPRMDGLEATRIIRALPSISQPTIVAVTANAMSGDIDKCLAAGMDDYLSKPIERDKLEQTIRRCLSQHLYENKE